MSATLTGRYRSLSRLVVAVAIISCPTTAGATIATMRCQTTVALHTWQPLPQATIQRVVEGRVLQQLTGSGKLTLLPEGADKQPDLTLRITARIIEDAEQFSVLAAAVPRRQSRAGSLGSVATVSIHGMNHKQIQQQMERAADEASRKLVALVTPWLTAIVSDEPTEKVVSVGRVPKPDWASALKLTRLGAGGPRDAGAVNALGLKAKREASARLALARCASQGGQKSGLQRRCIDALAQLARRHASAQRALIGVLFSDPPARGGKDWQEARRRAFRITTGFSGAARDEAVQAWLYILASDHSERYQLFGHRREDYLLLDTIADYLVRHTSVPNLDMALARCTRPAKYKGKPPSEYCLKVVKRVPLQRRLTLLHAQLAALPKFSFYDPWKPWVAMLETVVDRGKPLHPAVEVICMRRVQRSFEHPDRRQCLRYLGDQGRPRPELLQFLVAAFLSADKEIFLAADEALDDLVKRQTELCPLLERELGPAVQRRAIPRYYPRDSLPRGLRRCRGDR